MSQIQSLIESANPWQSQQGDTARLASKWAKSGLLEGLNGHDQSNMAVMLENQAKQLVVETSQTGTGGTFTPGTGEQWAGVALPLVRKVFGQIASKEFVSVQPMSLPVGLVFFLEFQYGTTKNPFTSGDSLYGTATQVGDSGFGNAAAGGLYGAGRYGYSINQFSASITVTTASDVASASFAQLGFDANYSSSIAGGSDAALLTVKAITVATSSIANFDKNAVNSIYIVSSSLVTTADNLNQLDSVEKSVVEFPFHK